MKWPEFAKEANVDERIIESLEKTFILFQSKRNILRFYSRKKVLLYEVCKTSGKEKTGNKSNYYT